MVIQKLYREIPAEHGLAMRPGLAAQRQRLRTVSSIPESGSVFEQEGGGGSRSKPMIGDAVSPLKFR